MNKTKAVQFIKCHWHNFDFDTQAKLTGLIDYIKNKSGGYSEYVGYYTNDTLVIEGKGTFRYNLDITYYCYSNTEAIAFAETELMNILSNIEEAGYIEKEYLMDIVYYLRTARDFMESGYDFMLKFSHGVNHHHLNLEIENCLIKIDDIQQYTN